MICGARGPSPGPRSARATLSPLPRGEGSDRARGLIVLQHKRACSRCVSCFTLGPADGIYAGDVTERSVMAVGGRLPPPLLGVSSLDLAPLAFSRRGLFPCAISDRDSSCPGLTPQVGFTRLAAPNMQNSGKPEFCRHRSKRSTLFKNDGLPGRKRVHARLPTRCARQ